MAINTGVNVSKLVAYAVVVPMPGVSVSKLTAYAVLAPKLGVNISKLTAYAVLSAINVMPPIWPGGTFPPGILGNPYDQYFDLSPASSPVVFSVVAGALPNGLSLWSQGSLDVTSCVGRVSGYPTQSGSFTFTIRASNAYGTADKSFSVAVSVPIINGSTSGAAFF
jgi:hypothetical protein